MPAKKTMLIIMDGWGLGKVPEADAILHAKTPFIDQLYHQYPNSQLLTCGQAVGLPEGQMGNSEVGHLNLGAGRVVYQELQRINAAIKEGELQRNSVLNEALTIAKTQHKKLHLIGLLSDGGVHAHIDHVKALIQYAEDYGIEKYYLHAFTDGRDTDPKSGLGYINNIQHFLSDKRGKLASVIGRFYAMDRDKRWERVKIAYDAMTKGIGQTTNQISETIKKRYGVNETDEFLTPIIQVDDNGVPIAKIEDGDVVICYNFRTDRCREVTQALTQSAISEYELTPLKLNYYTMTEYDASFKNVGVLLGKDNLNNTLGEVLQNHNLKQIRIAETEKYPHVTFFFSGGREQIFIGEKRFICPSPKDVKTYDQRPEMSAYDITNTIIPEIEQETADFICLNFANTDMVGHTGVWAAAVKAAETVNDCVSKIVPIALEHGYAIFLTADHGNSDYLINPDGTPNTAHSLNPVPLFLISNDYKGQLRDGKLGDIAPTILKYMALSIPEEMTGKVLID